MLALHEGMPAVISCAGRLHLKACQKFTYFALSALVSTGSLSLSLDSFMLLCLLAWASILSGATNRSVADRASMPRASVPDLFKPSCGSCFRLGWIESGIVPFEDMAHALVSGLTTEAATVCSRVVSEKDDALHIIDSCRCIVGTWVSAPPTALGVSCVMGYGHCLENTRAQTTNK